MKLTVTKKIKAEKPVLLILLSGLMIFPAILSIVGVIGFYIGDYKPGDPTRMESLHIAAYFLICSIIVWLPYLILLPFYVFKKSANKPWVILTTSPFFIMLVAVIFLVINGVIYY